MTPQEAVGMMDRWLGITSADCASVRDAPTLAAAEERYAAILKRAKSRRRQAARELHPDVTGGDPEKQALLGQVNDLLERLGRTPARALWRPPASAYADPYGLGVSSVTVSTSVGYVQVRFY